MQRADAQHRQVQGPADVRQGKGMALESPQGEQLAQLQAVADGSVQAGRLAQLAAMADASPAQAAQRRCAAMIDNSPHQAVQRRVVAAAAGGSRTTLQREGAEEPLQEEAKATQRAEAPVRPNDTGLPDNLKNGIESLSGISMDSVRVHYNSSQPAQLNALAYAQGNDIHVAPGQEKHLPHEAWHVVQQAQGRVKPSLQMKDGVPINDDETLEREADVMGGRAAQMKRDACDNATDLSSVRDIPGIAQRVLAVKKDGNPVDKSSVSRFIRLVNKIFGGRYILSKGSDDNFTLAPGKSRRRISNEAEVLYEVLSKIIGHPKTTSIEFTSNNKNVFIGQFETSEIDVSEAEKFGVDVGFEQGPSAASMLVHELEEQFQGQVNNIPVGETYIGEGVMNTEKDAHFHYAVPMEERAVGGYREGTGPKIYVDGDSAGDLEEEAENHDEGQSEIYSQLIKYSYKSGRVVIVEYLVVDGNVENVDRTIYPSEEAWEKSSQYLAQMDDEDVIEQKKKDIESEKNDLEKELEELFKKKSKTWSKRRLKKLNQRKSEIKFRLSVIKRELAMVNAKIERMNDEEEMDDDEDSLSDVSSSEEESSEDNSSDQNYFSVLADLQ